MSARRALFALFVGLSTAQTACGEGDDVLPPPPPSYGSAVVTWRLEDDAGNPLSCDDLSTEKVSISLGRETVDVPCGDAEEVRFDQLEPGIYGVTLRLDVIGRGQLLSQTDNLEVVANQEAELEMVVVIDLGSLSTGSIHFRWTIDGEPAPATCGVFGGETVRFTTDPSSIAQFTLEEDCTAGDLLVEELEPGIYEVRAELLDAAGARIGAPQQLPIRVSEGEQTDLSISFSQTPGAPATFLGVWTITSSVASADSCEDAGGDTVRVSLSTIPMGRQGVEIESATVSCDAGELSFQNLLGGPNPVRATFVLISDFLGPIATETSTSFFLVSGQTSTITADFVPTR